MEYTNLVFATLPSLLIIFFLWLHFYRNNGSQPSSLPRNYPILGMLPTLLLNLHRLTDISVEVLQQTHGTFHVKGPWFTKMDLLGTADPDNVQYVLSKNHHRFNRGANSKQILEIFGDGIFNTEGDLWKYQRKIGLAYFTSVRFRRLMAKTVVNKVEQGLIPLLERFCKDGLEVDLQDVMQRLTGDITFMLLIDHDPNYISFDSSRDSLQELAQFAEEVVLERHALPSCIWKTLKWLKIGKEGKLCELEEALNSFFYKLIGNKRDEMMKIRDESENGKVVIKGDDILSVYMSENYGEEGHEFKSQDIFLRDTFLAFLMAGQDTISSALTWFFWLLSEHPRVEAKIIKELTAEDFKVGYDIYQLSDPNKLVYLHAAVYETLRLYPPVPYNHMSPNKPETLPSGHKVEPWMMIILCRYAMGRMKWVWGEDCEDFKPERWITEEGKIKHEPSHKFFSFNAGPKICIGKEMTMVKIKAIVCAVLRHNYRFKLVEGHPIVPSSSIVLRMKYGLKVRVTKEVEP